MLVQERRRGHHHARRAEAALRRVLVVERLLDRRQADAVREALERRDLGALDRDERRQAGAPRLAVDEHGAGAAAALLAAGLRRRDVELLAQDAQERGEGVGADLLFDAVDYEVHRHPPLQPSCPSARCTSSGSICSRYQADASASVGRSSPSAACAAASAAEAPPASADSTPCRRCERVADARGGDAHAVGAAHGRDREHRVVVRVRAVEPRVAERPGRPAPRSRARAARCRARGTPRRPRSSRRRRRPR